jgi:hypothetical protein
LEAHCTAAFSFFQGLEPASRILRPRKLPDFFYNESFITAHPRVKQGNTGRLHILYITGYDNQTMNRRSRSDQSIHNRNLPTGPLRL